MSFSRMIAEARKAHPDLTFLVGDIEDKAFIGSLNGPFDIVLIVDTIGSLDDCQQAFENLHSLCTRETRLIVAYFSHMWHLLLKVAELLRKRIPQGPQNVLAPADVRAMANLGGFEPVKSEQRVLMPLNFLARTPDQSVLSPTSDPQRFLAAALYDMPITA